MESHSAPTQASAKRRRRRRNRLLERDAYLSVLEVLFSAAWEHPVGPIVVEARAGLGKTALVGGACQIAVDQGWTVLRSRGDFHKAQAPYSLLRRLLDSYEAEASKGPSPEEAPTVTVAKLDALVRKLSTEQGVLICVDDAQWADDESSQWLLNLGPWPLQQKCRLIVSIAKRTPGLQLHTVEKIASEPSARVMSLGPLSPAAIGSLASGYFSVVPDEPFIEACRQATGGNPFLLLALFRELHLERLPPKVSALEKIELVTSPAVGLSILTRLARLPPEAAPVLEAVAIAGSPIELDVVAEVTKLDSSTVGAAADDLAGCDLLTGERPLRFLHPFLQRAVRADIPPSRSARLHLEIAQSLRARGAPLEQLAAHLAASEPSGDEWVARKLEEAGSLALGQGASLEAIGYFNRARAELPAAQSSPEILLGLARAESSLRRRSALKHLRLALDQPVDPRAAALATMQVARAFNDLEARTELGPMLERTAELLSDEETDGKIDVAVAMGLIATSPQAPVLATESLRSAVGSRPDPGTRGEREALALIAVVDSASPRRAPRAELVALIRRAVLGAEFVSEDPLRCELWARVLLALARSSEFEEADRLARAAQAVARLQRLEYAEAEFSTTLAMSLALQGQLVEAEVEVSRALSVMEEQPWPRRVEAVACLASLCLDQGRTEEAERLIAPFEEPDSLPSPLGGAVLLEQRGRVRCLQGRRSEALADLFRAGRRAGECDVDSPVVTSWRSEAALTLAAEGWESDAVRFAEENLELARAHGAHWVVGAALHVLACVGPADRRLARLEEAVELLEGSPAQLRFASATIDLGRVLRESGSSSMRIRSLLRDAADLAFRSRATPLVSSAMTELRLSGARPRRLALSGADSLTSSERRVASLAVDGLSNAEIAVALFLAEKTVEGHLGHAFRKLGIRSRRDLEALGDLGPEESTG